MDTDDVKAYVSGVGNTVEAPSLKCSVCEATLSCAAWPVLLEPELLLLALFSSFTSIMLWQLVHASLLTQGDVEGEVGYFS